MNKIYTKTGDNGETSLVNGQRILKSSKRVNTYGDVDEANSVIGTAVSLMSHSTTTADFSNEISELRGIQFKLFHIGAELANPSGVEGIWTIEQQDIINMENLIDNATSKLPDLKNFIVPGGSLPGSQLHVARTIVRRAERGAVSLLPIVNPLVIKYLNRLSDYLFQMARLINKITGDIEFDVQPKQ